MRSQPVATWRQRFIAHLAVVAICVGVTTSVAAGDVLVIRQSLVSNGGGFVFDDCYRLLSAIGQPVLGTVGDVEGEFTLRSGFLAETPSTDDKLFRSGFETSPGICKP